MRNNVYFRTGTVLVFLGFLCGPVATIATEMKHGANPKHIITLVPSLAEMLVAIGVSESEIVGVSEYTDYPESLAKKPIVGTFARISLETVLSLKPDLILASRDGTSKDVIARLRRLKLNVQVIPLETLAEIRGSFDVLGKLVGRRNDAFLVGKKWDQKIEEFRVREKKRNSGSERKTPKVLLQVGENPLIVVGGKSFLSEGLQLIGVENVYADAPHSYPRVSFEDVIQKDPAAILLLVSSDSRSQMKNAEKRWTGFQRLMAARNHRIYLVESDALVRPGPRFLEGLAILERVIFPDERQRP